MRYLGIAAIGVGSMAAAWFAFALAFTDGSPLAAVVGDAGIFLVPAVVIAGGVLAAAVDRAPRAYLAVVAGAVATVVGYAAWYRLTAGSGSEFVEFAAIGIGLAVSMLTVGFVPTAAILWLVARRAREP
jgi:hypothetical protein